MVSEIRKKLPRLVLTLLLSLGLTSVVLKGLGLAVPWGPVIAVCVLGSLLLEAVFLTRRSALLGSASLAVLLLFWLLAGPGASLLQDLLRALTLRVTGIPGALPLVAREFSLAAAAALTVLSFCCARQNAGSLGCLMLTFGALLLIWLADRPELIPYLLPAGAASVCLLALERHPGTSLVRLLPWAAGLLLLGFWLTPKAGLVLPSLKEKTDAFRQSVMDRLFFTEPRDVFSLASEGYYPQGTGQLGGPVHPSDRPVMQVSTPRAVYLRGAILNEYDGRSWRNTLGGRRYLWASSAMASERTLLFDQNLPKLALPSSLTEPATVSVRMLADSCSTLFVPQRVRSLQAGGELVPYFTNSSELFVTRNLQPGDTWALTAPLFQAGDPGLGTLVEAVSGAEDARWEEVLEIYLGLPSHLEEPVRRIAWEASGSFVSPYDRAFALQNYLSRNFRYTLDVAPQPANLDFVTNFLLYTREGYCTYFASAMTVLCRMIGLPARYVEGYLAEPDENGEALVTGLNAHAWTEVYFRGFGWVVFDATPRRFSGNSGGSSSGEASPPPGPENEPEEPEASDEPEEPEDEPSPPPEDAGEAETPSPEPENEPDEPEASDEPDEPEEPENPEDPDRPASPAGVSPGLLLLLILLLAALALWLRWFLTSPFRREKKLTEEADRFNLWLGETLSRLSAAGYVREPGETLMNFTRRLDAQEVLPASLGQLGECASLLCYGRVHALETDTALAREAALLLRKGLPRKARLIYALRRLGPQRKKPLEA